MWYRIHAYTISIPVRPPVDSTVVVINDIEHQLNWPMSLFMSLLMLLVDLPEFAECISLELSLFEFQNLLNSLFVLLLWSVGVVWPHLLHQLFTEVTLLSLFEDILQATVQAGLGILSKVISADQYRLFMWFVDQSYCRVYLRLLTVLLAVLYLC